MCEKTMYEKIMEETRKIPESRTSKRLKQQITHLFIYSKEYAELYKTVQHIYNAKKILNSYLFDVSYFTITDKLYIEFFFECYKRVAPEEDKKHLEKNFIKKYVFSDKSDDDIKSILHRLCKNTEHKNDNDINEMVEYIKDSLYQWEDCVCEENSTIDRMKQLKIDNLHYAITEFEKALQKCEKHPSECVEEIFTLERLEYIWGSLVNARNESDEKMQERIYAILHMEMTPLLSALVSGSIKSYTPAKRGKMLYFSKNFEYNLQELRNHVKENIESYMPLYEEYKEVSDKINAFKQLLNF